MVIESGLNHLLFNFASSSPILFNMKNFTFQNSIINNVKTMLLFDNPEGDIIVDSVLFANISVDESISFLKLKQAKTLTVNYLNFENWERINPNNENNPLIDLEEISSQVDGSITFDQISVSQTPMDILKISNIMQSREIIQNLTFNNISIQDMAYTSDAELMKINNIKSNKRFKIILNRLIMKNLKFESRSNIMLLQHQTQEPLEINDSVFDNITSGLITVRNNDFAYQVIPLVTLSNLTVINNDIFIW